MKVLGLLKCLSCGQEDPSSIFRTYGLRKGQGDQGGGSVGKLACCLSLRTWVQITSYVHPEPQHGQEGKQSQMGTPGYESSREIVISRSSKRPCSKGIRQKATEDT